MALYSYGPYGFGPYSYGPYRYGPYSYGLMALRNEGVRQRHWVRSQKLPLQWHNHDTTSMCHGLERHIVFFRWHSRRRFVPHASPSLLPPMVRTYLCGYVCRLRVSEMPGDVAAPRRVAVQEELDGSRCVPIRYPPDDQQRTKA